jgi:tellurite resistance protein
MTTRADFTEDEWKALQKGVTGAGVLVSISDRDFTDSFGEATAIAKYLAEQRETSESAVVRDLAKVRGTGFGLTASLQEVEAETLDALRSASEILSAKAPEELDAYRTLVVDVADRAANAKGGLSPEEASALEKVKGVLGQA